MLGLQRVSKVIVLDPEIMSGAPVFRGTRVPIQALLDHLESGVSLEEFLDNFPTVSRDQAIRFLELAGESVVATLRADFHSYWPQGGGRQLGLRHNQVPMQPAAGSAGG